MRFVSLLLLVPAVTLAGCFADRSGSRMVDASAPNSVDGGAGECEGVDLSNDLNNCGACGNVCPTGANGVRVCRGGACRFDCDPGFGDCDADPSTGCESRLDEPDHCGSCGNHCSLPGTAQHAAPVCVGGSCDYACDPGFGDCDGLRESGCEVNLNVSRLHCGECDHRCSGGMCADGACSG